VNVRTCLICSDEKQRADPSSAGGGTGTAANLVFFAGDGPVAAMVLVAVLRAARLTGAAALLGTAGGSCAVTARVVGRATLVDVVGGDGRFTAVAAAATATAAAAGTEVEAVVVATAATERVLDRAFSACLSAKCLARRSLRTCRLCCCMSARSSRSSSLGAGAVGGTSAGLTSCERLRVTTGSALCGVCERDESVDETCDERRTRPGEARTGTRPKNVNVSGWNGVPSSCQCGQSANSHASSSLESAAHGQSALNATRCKPDVHSNSSVLSTMPSA
jgi:hypothetical protein